MKKRWVATAAIGFAVLAVGSAAALWVAWREPATSLAATQMAAATTIVPSAQTATLQQAAVAAATVQTAEGSDEEPQSFPGTYFGWSKVEGKVGMWKKHLVEGEISGLIDNNNEIEEIQRLVASNPQKYYQEYLLDPQSDVGTDAYLAGSSLLLSKHPIAVRAFVESAFEGGLDNLYEFIPMNFGFFENPSVELRKVVDELAVPLFKSHLHESDVSKRVSAAQTLYRIGYKEEAVPVLMDLTKNHNISARVLIEKRLDVNCGCEMWFWDPILEILYEQQTKAPSHQTRQIGAHSLIRIGKTEKAMLAIEDLLRENPPSYLMKDVLFDLGLIGSPDAMRIVVNYASRGTPDVQAVARGICKERQVSVSTVEH